MNGNRPGPASPGHRIACSAELANLPHLLTLVTDVCRQEGVGPEVMHDLQLVAEEACVNVMRHAYPRGQTGRLALAVRVEQRGAQRAMLLTLEDQGRAFDPLSIGPPATSDSAETRAVGGLGVHLIRQLSDRQHYRHDPQRGNVFTIEKNLAPAQPS